MSSRFRPAQIVSIKQLPEILDTLDENGTLDALPFMPEMAAFCGRCFAVSRCLERTCEGALETMRRIRNAVFLDDLRCDGSAHGGCQKGCRFFWKESWLKSGECDPGERAAPVPEANIETALPCRHKDGRYICQSTELIRATDPLSLWNIEARLSEMRNAAYSPADLAGMLSSAVLFRLGRVLSGKSQRVLQGRLQTTPAEALNLQPGEWVQVKTEAEIERTLDREGKNRGLAFTLTMLPFCGRSYRVRNRLDRMIHEPTGQLIEVANTVVLDGVACDGSRVLRGPCPRENYFFWREIWLKRAQTSR